MGKVGRVLFIERRGRTVYDSCGNELGIEMWVEGTLLLGTDMIQVMRRGQIFVPRRIHPWWRFWRRPKSYPERIESASIRRDHDYTRWCNEAMLDPSRRRETTLRVTMEMRHGCRSEPGSQRTSRSWTCIISAKDHEHATQLWRAVGHQIEEFASREGYRE